MQQLKNFILIVLSLLSSQFVMYYFIDEIIVMFASSLVPYIIGRLLLGYVIFGCLKFLMKEIKIDSVYIEMAMILYLILLVSITLFKGGSKSYEYNFIPFNFLSYASEVNPSIFITALVINMLLLAPLGAYLRIKNIKFIVSWQTILYSSLIIEGLQFFTKRGSFDVDDLLLNTLGGCVAYFVVGNVNRRILRNKLSTSSRKPL
ncbi:MAG: VanZ family protein [Carnobacterium alterfunditum]